MIRSVPLQVTAHLAHGLVTGHPWGVALDGLLASVVWAETVDAADDPAGLPWPSQTHVPPDLDLPLARCTLAGEQLWHWAATCAQPGPARREVRYRSRHFNHNPVEALSAAMPVSVHPGGRYGRRRMPDLVAAITSLTWRAVGDPDRVEELLTQIPAIGKGRTHGEGVILHWDVAPVPNGDVHAFSHLHLDGSIGRACPPDCLPDSLREGRHPIIAGLRPPLMHPARQHTLYVPDPIRP